MIEGIDGAGKRTLAEALEGALAGRVARMAFPRYGVSVYGDLIRDGLHGRLGAFGDEVHGMAMLYALDRREAAPDIRALLDAHDYVLLDRYVASNAAFGAARLHQGAGGEFVGWVHEIELGRFGVPVPHAHLLLRVPPVIAAARSTRRAQTEADRGRDTWESDDALQSRVAAVYDGLAAADWLAPWHVVDGSTVPDTAELAKKLAE
ncbi:dTMP kinase [Actinophytocola oryzae]|uniref:Thymidylate kinase n=1 Tax=Actinophytocola oryzae TaxID=502181 RepID=A0A4R7UQV6_9PSEU|nr:dTMP kinase [Actinophytocola oryzae]